MISSHALLQKKSVLHPKRAFTLIELLIVILIVSMVYILVFASMSKSSKETQILKISNIKSILKDQNITHQDVELLCLEESEECYIDRGGEIDKFNVKSALGNIQAYKLDKTQDLIKVDFGRIKEKPIALRFGLFHNGSSSQLILENKSGIYYLPPLFGEPQKATSLDEAKELWLANKDVLKDSGDFY